MLFYFKRNNGEKFFRIYVDLNMTIDFPRNKQSTKTVVDGVIVNWQEVSTRLQGLRYCPFRSRTKQPDAC